MAILYLSGHHGPTPATLRVGGEEALRGHGLHTAKGFAVLAVLSEVSPDT